MSNKTILDIISEAIDNDTLVIAGMIIFGIMLIGNPGDKFSLGVIIGAFAAYLKSRSK